MAAKHVMVISDSCYSGTLSRQTFGTKTRKLTRKEKVQRFNSLISRRSRTVLSSGGLEPVFDSAGGDHSVFAAPLLEILENNTEVVDGEDLYNKLFPKVKKIVHAINADQSPEYAPIKSAGHDSGGFLFIPKI
jgi:hypothetical protein